MPTPPKQPVLEDPYQIQEAFATEVAVATVGRGVLRLTFATERIESARDNEPPQAKRIVISRLILDNGGASQLWDYLQRLNLAAAGQPPQTISSKKPN